METEYKDALSFFAILVFLFVGLYTAVKYLPHTDRILYHDSKGFYTEETNGKSNWKSYFDKVLEK